MMTEEGLTGEAFVLHLDVLGFAALVEAHPHGMVQELDDQKLRVNTYITESGSRFRLFHSVLDQVLEQRFESGPSDAMVFSDCAFLVYQNALLAAVHSTGLLRHLVKAHVPVRMGLAYGTYDRQALFVRFSGLAQCNEGRLLRNRHGSLPRGRGTRRQRLSHLRPSVGRTIPG
jgi:hypothetical protein